MRLIWLAFLMPLAAQAQETGSLTAAMDSLAGKEVVMEGYIGTGLDMMDQEALSFRTLDGTGFPVVFDAGREARRKLEGCRFQIFGGTPCRMTGKAELEWDGSRLRLIVFDVETIEPPANLP